MKKRGRFTRKIILLILTFLMITLGFAFLVKAFYPEKKTYHSEFLKITIDYSTKFDLEEKFGTITLKNKEGEIIITTTGTNYSSLDEYIKASDELNETMIKVMRKRVKINNWDGVVSNISYENNPSLNHKGYIFYKDYGVYSLFTTSSNLYSDLDKITKSFRYEP